MNKKLSTGCIVILGAPNDKEGNLSTIAKLRLDKGAEEWSKHPDFKILLTGGFGNHFNETNQPHWMYAKKYLLEKYLLPPQAFLTETIESSNTVEDIEKAEPVFKKYNFKKIIVVTSAFHQKRVRFIINKVLDNHNKIVYSCASDKVLPQTDLDKLQAHEKKAIAYLKANYGKKE